MGNQEVKIHFVFSSSGYLDVSVRRVPSRALWIHARVRRVLPCVGCPIQIPADRWVFAPPRGEGSEREPETLRLQTAGACICM